MGRVGSIVNHAIVWLVCLQVHQCSEFPERECCDPIYPLIPELDALPPNNQPTTTISSSPSYAVGVTGVGILTGRSGEFHGRKCCENPSQKVLFFIQFNSSRDCVGNLPPSDPLLFFSDIEFPSPIGKFAFLFFFSILSQLNDMDLTRFVECGNDIVKMSERNCIRL